MFKRAYLSVTRRKNKTIILGLILFVIANLVLASITIKNATEQSVDYARQSLGSKVYLTADMDKIRNEMRSQRDLGLFEGGFSRVELPDIYLEDVLKLTDIEYVLDYSYGFSFNVNAGNFEAIKSKTNSSNNSYKNYTTIGNINIEAINAYALIPGVVDGTIELIEGDFFDEANENDAIISYELSILNNLKLDDVIEIETLDGETKEFNIIGIYDALETDDQTSKTLIDPANNIYVNINSGASLLSTEDYNDGNYVVKNATFYLDDPINSSAFLEKGNQLITDLEERNLILDIDTAAYEKMIGPIEGVEETSSSILIIVILAAVVILSLLIINQIKDRNYEIGVLMSLGEKKIKISTQLLIELIIIATFAFTLSLGTSKFISKKLGESMLESQIEMAEQQTDTSHGRGMGMFGTSIYNDISNVKTIDKLNINASINDYLILFGTGYLIIILSLIFPIIQIVKYEPKTILSRKDG